MNRGVSALLGAQFLSAFADNAILFVAIAMVMQASQQGDWYVPALQSSFLVAFVVLAPWVGRLADRWSKPRVLVAGNAIKALGTLMILVGVSPLIAYAVVGAGAAVYGPAKYGILPELVDSQSLVKANGWIEGSTILAIVLGTVVGARLADFNVTYALWLIVLAFGVSIAVTLLIPSPAPRGTLPGDALTQFVQKSGAFLVGARARFSMLGASLFWASAAVLRVLLVAFGLSVLGFATAGDIADLTLVLAIGIVVGAGLAPRLIPLQGLRRARLAAYAMGALIVVLSLVDTIWPARLVLFAIGITGGLFVVPVNAALQDIGHRSIGAGAAVAIQNFFENLAMLIAVGVYTYAAANHVDPVITLVVLGIAVMVATLLVARHLPPDAQTPPEELARLAGNDPS